MLGYIRVAAGVHDLKLANPKRNVEALCNLIDKAVEKKTAIITFPESSLTGNSCGDLLGQHVLIDAEADAVDALRRHTVGKDITVIVGTRECLESGICSGACVIRNGKVLGGSGNSYRAGDATFSIITGDIKSESVAERILQAAKHGADIIFNPSSGIESVSKCKFDTAQYLSSLCHCAIVECRSGYGESTTSGVYSGYSGIYEDGELIAGNKMFRTGGSLTIADIDIELLHGRSYGKCGIPVNEVIEIQNPVTTDVSLGVHRPKPDPLPFVSTDDNFCRKALDIQATALASRMDNIGCRKVVIGISGGLDSTLAMICAINAFDRMGWSREGIICITMPGFGTSGRTYSNAIALMEALGVTSREICIADACRQHFKDISHDGITQDTAYENTQARERTQILMDVANMEGAIVIGTGDLSELALGWCTYNGDHMSNYAVNASIPKTLVRALTSWAADNLFEDKKVAETLKDIVATPVSPELKGGSGRIEQKTEDIIGPYELHDFFLYHLIVNRLAPAKILFLARRAFEGEFTTDEIDKWLRLFLKRFFIQQFKRSCAPDGPKVTEVSLDPRSGWKVPSDAAADAWLDF